MTGSASLFAILWLSFLLHLNAFSQTAVHESSSTDYINFYQKFISGIRGQECPMYPSCSSFSKVAFQSRSFSTAFILTADRLVRCGHDLKEYDLTLRPSGFKWLDFPQADNSPKHLRFSGDAVYYTYGDLKSDSDSSVVFIKSLINNGFYNQALLEIKRYEFYKPFNKEVFVNELLCLKAVNEYEKAIYVYETKCPQPLKNDADILYQVATVYYKLDNFKRALQLVTTALANTSNNESRSQLTALKGFLYACLYQWQDAKNTFVDLRRLPYREDALESNLKLVGKGEAFRYKKPAIASLLSIIPGAGYAYLGNTSTAVSSLLLNGVFGYATYTSIRKKNYGVAALTGLFSVSFYIANIYGAGQSAKHHNDKQKRNIINNLLININP
jgi:putative component of membrane protein insertase Oxa1/YidC/SpoIIIJ protein YidD